MKRAKIPLPVDTSNTGTPWLWIGTWSMGGEGFGPHDERESREVLELAVRYGIRHFDTAGLYAHGRSEELLAKLIGGRRPEFFISTKGGLLWKGRRVMHDATPAGLKGQLYKSLRRLKTDYIDLYQLHRPAPDVSIRESLDALKEFKEEGLIRYWGVGNLNPGEVEENLRGERDIPHQVHFNPVHRADDLLLVGKDSCINCIISPLEQGLLGNGTSAAGRTALGKRDIRRRNRYFFDEKVLRWSERLRTMTDACRVPVSVVTLLWIAARPHVHVIIPGPRRTGQVREILQFRLMSDEYGRSDGEELKSVLSEDKIRAVIPGDLWDHLNRGPFKEESMK
ncbi:general stress protein 69 [bacterium BMS3Bbin06]|nr:general stress protein 69 [bacterium BMS3Bbin06]